MDPDKLAGTLKVTVCEARDLLAKDDGGSQLPRARVALSLLCLRAFEFRFFL